MADRGPCGKLKYASVRMARMAHTKAHYRVRTYWCDECRAHHVTNGEKRQNVTYERWRDIR